jgi:hypothetical protein
VCKKADEPKRHYIRELGKKRKCGGDHPFPEGDKGVCKNSNCV